MRGHIRMRTDDYIAKRYETRAEWLKGRMDSVGASEVSLVLGIAPPKWGNAHTLWERKRNPVIEEGGNEDTIRGSRAEEHIRELLGIENPYIKVVDMTGIIFRSRKFPWLTCSLDAAIVHPDGKFTIVEIKDVRYTAHWKSGSYPRYYKYQCATQMLVTGATDAILVARINYDFGGGRDEIGRLCEASVREERIRIRRSAVKGQFAGIVRETKEFWQHVKDGTEPDIIIRR